MASKPRGLIIAAALLSLGACATPSGPVEVTRFHLGQPIERGSVVIEPISGADRDSLEFRTYSAAVGRELQRLGFVPSQGVENALFVANVEVTRDTRAALARRSPVSVGIGGGSGGFGGGIGGGISFGLGGGGSGDTVITQLSVQLKRRAGLSTVWEGRAQTQSREKAPAAQPGLAADKLAAALFQGFPGESGRTITVK